MEDAQRRAKRHRNVDRLRDISPARTVEMGFQLTDFARKLQKAAEDARR